MIVPELRVRAYGVQRFMINFGFGGGMALAGLVGVLVTLQAYVWPFTLMVVH